jgi:hypothetical protein
VLNFSNKTLAKIALQYSELNKTNFLKSNYKRITNLKILNELACDAVKFSTKIIKDNDNLFESETFKTLFNDRFKTLIHLDSLENPITTVINRKTKKPVNIIIKEISQGEYEFRTAAPKQLNNLLGMMQIDINRKGYNATYIQRMTTETGKKEYAGIGTRMHQFAIEKSIQTGTNGRVALKAADLAPIFHFQNGFRAEKYFDFQLKKNVDPNITLIKSILTDDKRDIIRLITMTLSGKQLKRWKELIFKQPILRE